jgi:hypothetical protein
VKKKKAQVVTTVGDNLPDWLKEDLDLKRLNDIHGLLWMCGRPFNARALHQQQLMNRRTLVTEKLDLHLLYYSDIMMIKPLPMYILCKEVWDEYLNGNVELHKSACGLLMSYIWLVRSPNDFAIAMDKNLPVKLLPDGLEWLEWKAIVDEVLKNLDADSLHQVNDRFQFGELRLGRINSIYRINPRFIRNNFVRGYMYGYNRYAPFLQRNVAWVLGASVLLGLVLSAMQVGTGLDLLQNNNAFKLTSFGFVIFSCILVGLVLGGVIFIFVFIYFFNMKEALTHAWREKRRRKKLAAQGGEP